MTTDHRTTSRTQLLRVIRINEALALLLLALTLTNLALTLAGGAL